jgi:hypothetical protein
MVLNRKRVFLQGYIVKCVVLQRIFMILSEQYIRCTISNASQPLLLMLHEW